MKSIFSIAVIVSLLGSVSAQSPAWGQCGGQGWSGSTTCVAGYTCTYSNPYYSQCLPGIVTTTPGPTTIPTTTTTQPGTPSTTTTTGPAPTGSQIRTVQDPVYHFYLQNNGGTPMLGPESSSGRFNIGGTIALNSASGSSKLYLNIDNSGTQSYKALTFGTTATTTNWGLEGDTIITTSPRQLNFIACPGTSAAFWNVYLQTGNDSPPGKTCTLVTMHLPCLC